MLESERLDDKFFGEGLSVDEVTNTCAQLTWREGVCLIRDATTLALSKMVPLPKGMQAGWGLTSNGAGAYWASDGSSTLHELDSASLKVQRTVRVKLPSGGELANINDLQWVDGVLWANVYQTDRLAAINPLTGAVLGFVDLSLLLTSRERRLLGYEDVLNGIAYNPSDGDHGCLYVTGKCWPKLFKIEVPRVRQQDV